MPAVGAAQAMVTAASRSTLEQALLGLLDSQAVPATYKEQVRAAALRPRNRACLPTSEIASRTQFSIPS
eukprot:COSAG02_NODE_1051_length_14956_cov_3.414216_8_plen_69_part_00